MANSIGTLDSVSKAIDMKPDEFKRYMLSLNLTELLGLKKLLELEYQKVERIKNDLLKAIQKDKVDKVAGRSSLEDLYQALLVVEGKCTLIEEEKTARRNNVKDS